MPLPRRLLALGLALASFGAASCDLFTGPGSPDLEGVLDRQITGMPGRPFGLGMSRRGVGLALLLDTELAAPFTATADTSADGVALAYNPIDVAFTADGSRAFVTILDADRVYEVDVASGEVVDSATFGAHHHRILLSPDESRYWVTSTQGQLWTVDRATGTPVDSAWFSLWPILSIAHRSSDNSLIIANGPVVRRLSAATLQSLDTAAVGGLTQQVVLSRRSGAAALFVARESENDVLVLDPTSLAVTDSIEFGEELTFRPFGMALSRDGRTLIVSSSQSGAVAIIDAHTRRVGRILTTTGTPRRIALSPNGHRVFVTNEAGWIDVIR